MSKYGDIIRSKVSSELIKVEIPEWGEGDEPMVVYTKNLTCGDFNKLQLRHPNFLNNQTIEGLVDLIILKACVELISILSSAFIPICQFVPNPPATAEDVKSKSGRL